MPGDEPAVEKTKEPPTTEETEDETKTKKQKMALEQAPDNEWPDCWVMPDGDCADQKALNKKEPNEPVDAEFLRKLGIRCVTNNTFFSEQSYRD